MKNYNHKRKCKCELCGDVFERGIYYYKTFIERWKIELCIYCIRVLSVAMNLPKQKETNIHRLSILTDEEKKKKYSNDVWKRIPKWIEQQRSKDGHGDRIKYFIRKGEVILSNPERFIKAHGVI
jgi:hypothetical protein